MSKVPQGTRANDAVSMMFPSDIWTRVKMATLNVSPADDHTFTALHPFNGIFPGQSGSDGTRKVNHSGFYWSKRWWGGSGISWTICKSFAPHSRQKTKPVPHHFSFYRPDAVPAAQPTASKHWRQVILLCTYEYSYKHCRKHYGSWLLAEVRQLCLVGRGAVKAKFHYAS